MVEEKAKAVTIDGWNIELRMFAYEYMTNVDTLDNHYHTEIWLRRLKDEKRVELGTMSVVEIDSIQFVLVKSGQTLTAHLYNVSWVSNASDPELIRGYSFGKQFVRIPLDEVVTLKFQARVRQGRHILWGNVPEDSVVVDALSPHEDTVQIVIPIVRQDSKNLAPAF